MSIEGISTVACRNKGCVQKSILTEHPLIPPVYLFKLVDIAFLNTMYSSVLEVVEQAHRSLE
jgi:hypothetical protein